MSIGSPANKGNGKGNGSGTSPQTGESTRPRFHFSAVFCPRCDEFMEDALAPVAGSKLKTPVHRCPRCEHIIPRERNHTSLPETGGIIYPSTGGGGRVECGVFSL